MGREARAASGRRAAELAGLVGAGDVVGAIVFPQRFGGSLNLNLHLHVLVLDGLVARSEPGASKLSFRDTGHPTQEVLERVASRTRDRMIRWLRRRRLLDERREEDRADQAVDEAARALELRRPPLDRPHTRFSISDHLIRPALSLFAIALVLAQWLRPKASHGTVARDALVGYALTNPTLYPWYLLPALASSLRAPSAIVWALCAVTPLTYEVIDRHAAERV